MSVYSSPSLTMLSFQVHMLISCQTQLHWLCRQPYHCRYCIQLCLLVLAGFGSNKQNRNSDVFMCTQILPKFREDGQNPPPQSFIFKELCRRLDEGMKIDRVNYSQTNTVSYVQSTVYVWASWSQVVDKVLQQSHDKSFVLEWYHHRISGSLLTVLHLMVAQCLSDSQITGCPREQQRTWR